MKKTIITRIKDYFEHKKIYRLVQLQIAIKHNELLDLEKRRAELDIEVTEQAKILNSMLDVNKDEVLGTLNDINEFVQNMKDNPNFTDEFYKRIKENSSNIS